MKLAENLHRMRRERGLTQEQLAEAMDVSAAAVSKWECGLSVPDVTLIMALADFFETSVDALLGYALHNQSREDALSRMNTLADAKHHTEAVNAAHDVLRRYPNDFRVLHKCMHTLGIVGMETHAPTLFREALTLSDRAMATLPQNDDPEVSRETLLSQQGLYHTKLEAYDEAIRCYRAGNIAGINDIEIGQALSALHRNDEAIPLLATGWMRGISSVLNGSMGLVSCLTDAGEYDEGIALCRWLNGLLEGLAVKPGSYANKFRVMVLAVEAMLASARHDPAAARDCLTRAVTLAAGFDADPDYTACGMRFYRGKAYAMADDIALTAYDALVGILQQSDAPDERAALLHLLSDVKDEVHPHDL